MTDWNASSPEEIQAMLTAAAEEMRKRAAVKDWEPSDAGPPILFVEEIHDFAADGEAIRRLKQMLLTGRKADFNPEGDA